MEAASSRFAPNSKQEEERQDAASTIWRAAAGTFDGWPNTAKELTCLDPCMGSGHFVVAMFERLVALRLAEEKLDEAAAVAAVIRDNLFGLEIDPRCTQIGAFNLALAAWRRVGHCKLPAMNLACSGLAPNTREADWLAIVDAASSRTPNEKQKRQDAAATVDEEKRQDAATTVDEEKRQDAATTVEASATFAPINYFRPDEPVANLTGNLPHWRQPGTTYFVTFRCADALPQEKLDQWQQELDEWLAAHPEPHDDATRQEFYERFPQRIQTWLDSGYGECVLREPAMRQIVESALRHFDGQRYRLAEFVVAANHVHALVTPLGEHLLSDILHSWKSFTSNQINKARGKSGTFWQKESFDHIVRSPASLAKFREYILSHNNVAGDNVAAASSRSPSPVTVSNHSQPEEERLEAAATMRLRSGMERLYRLFQKAAVLGSLINPRAGEGDLLVAAFHELQPLLEKALKVEEASGLSSEQKGKSLEGSATLHGNVAAASSRSGRQGDATSNVVAASSRTGESLEGSATLHGNVAAASSRSGRQGDATSNVVAASSRTGESLEGSATLHGNVAAASSRSGRQGDATSNVVAASSRTGESLEGSATLHGNVTAASSRSGRQGDATSNVVAASSRTGESLEGSATLYEVAVTARGLAKAAEILASQFTLVATNVPYLGRGKQDEVLQDYCERVYPESKADLATCFVERCVDFAGSGNSTALVTPQSWLFMGTYNKLRGKLLASIQWDSVGRLGTRAFETISGEVVNVALLGFTRARPDTKHTFAGIDVAEEKSPADKAEGLQSKSCEVVLQSGADFESRFAHFI